MEEFNHKELLGIHGETNWIRVKYFPRIFVNADSSRDPEWFAKTEHRTRETHTPNHLYVNAQRHRLDKKIKWLKLYFDFRKVKEYAKRSSQEHCTFLGPGDEKKWYETLLYKPEGKCDSTATQMGGTIKGYKSSSIQEY